VHVFGIAYKRDISDMRESPALDVLELLHGRGAHISYTDPYVPHLEYRGLSLTSIPEQDVSSAVDCAVICTDHRAFDYAAMPGRYPLVVDTRNALKHADAGNVFRL